MTGVLSEVHARVGSVGVSLHQYTHPHLQITFPFIPSGPITPGPLHPAHCTLIPRSSFTFHISGMFCHLFTSSLCPFLHHLPIIPSPVSTHHLPSFAPFPFSNLLRLLQSEGFQADKSSVHFLHRCCLTR